MKKTLIALLLISICFNLNANVTKDSDVYINNVHAISITATGQEPFSAKAPTDLGRPSVAVVLSGGGARGLAHIAVLEALEEKGIPIDMIMGTSMGALIAGLYSAGYSSGDIRRLVTENDLTTLFSEILETEYQSLIEPFEDTRFNVLSLALNEKNIGDNSGLISDKKILSFFHQILSRIPEDIGFDELTVPYRAVATDATSGDYVLLEGGSLVDAMRASMSIPLVFDAYELEGLYLLDGGMVDNMPVAYAKSLGYDIVIAVDMNASSTFNADDMHTITGAANASFNLIVINTIKNQYSSATLVLTPEVSDFAVLDFSDSEAIIQRGTDEVQNHEAELDEIAALFADFDYAKDPSRIGPYFSLSEAGTEATESNQTEEVTKENQWSKLITNEEKPDALAGSRLLLGVSGVAEFYTKFDGETPVLLQFLPEMKSKFFMKNVANTEWDLSIFAYLGDNILLDTCGYYPLSNVSSKLYFNPSIALTLGSVSTISNRANPKLNNSTDFEASIEVGFKFSDGKCYNLNAGFKNRLYVLGQTVNGFGPNCFAIPTVFFNGIWYGNYEQDLFSTSGLRVDFISSAGLYESNFNYVLGLSYEQRIPLTSFLTLSLDAKAYSNREPVQLMGSYLKFGGWDGIPGASNSLYSRDLITLGCGVQFGIGGFLSSYLLGQVRLGWRSETDAFALASTGSSADNICTAPFSELNIFDLGFGLGYGVQTPICEIIVGLGVSIKGEFAIYFECY